MTNDYGIGLGPKDRLPQGAVRAFREFAKNSQCRRAGVGKMERHY